MDLSNGQLTPNNNTPLLTQALSGEVMLGIYICVFMFHILLLFRLRYREEFHIKMAEWLPLLLTANVSSTFVFRF